MGDLFDLERALRLGTLPAVVTGSEEYAIDLLSSYAESYLREEVQAEGIVRNLGGFARFLDVAAAQSGDILNAEAVAREAALSARTVREYFHPRFHLFDTGVTNALCRRLHATLDPAARGRLFE
jgi:predicted AAA+ superfamily ATPase